MATAEEGPDVHKGKLSPHDASDYTYSLHGLGKRRAPQHTLLKEFGARFIGARPAVLQGEESLAQVFHFQRGKTELWRDNVPSYATVLYQGLYDGIDLRVRGHQGALKYEFIVAPGADWTQLCIQYDGIHSLKLRGDGALQVELGEGWAPLRDNAPIITRKSKVAKLT